MLRGFYQTHPSSKTVLVKEENRGMAHRWGKAQ
jgi:hypothetical protein